MQNRIPDVARVEHAMRRGWPEGTDELHRDIPALLERVRELENALSPFARVWQSESKNPAAHPDFLANVYLKHCHVASIVLDPAHGAHRPVDSFFSMPAE